MDHATCRLDKLQGGKGQKINLEGCLTQTHVCIIIDRVHFWLLTSKSR